MSFGRAELETIICWMNLSDTEYKEWKFMDLFVNSHAEYHKIHPSKRPPAEGESYIQSQMDIAFLYKDGVMPYYVEWFVRQKIYPLFVINGDKPAKK